MEDQSILINSSKDVACRETLQGIWLSFTIFT